MKISYTLRYCWNSIWHKYDRTFAFLNIFSITITVMIFVALTSLLISFKDYTENILNRLPLRIEIFKSKDTLFSDLRQMEDKIKETPGYSSLSKRVPTFLSFLDSQGKVVPARDLPKGSTIQPSEPFVLKDIYDKPIVIASKEELQHPIDEVGLVISFSFLKKLGYLPDTAIFAKKDSWSEQDLPKTLSIYLIDDHASIPLEAKLPVPIIAIVPNIDRGEYLICESFYNVLLHWQHTYQYILQDRAGQPLVIPTVKISKAYYVLTTEQVEVVYEYLEELEGFIANMDLEIFPDSWEGERTFEERLTILPLSQKPINPENLAKIDKKIRSYEELRNLPEIQKQQENAINATLGDIAAIKHEHQYIQAALYIQDRQYIRPALQYLRGMGLFATSSLEGYLQTFERQERFFVGATLVIFSLIAFLSAIVLFSTFYTGVQRKQKQIGILKAFGTSGWLISALFYLESVIISCIAIPFGIAAGTLIGISINKWINEFAKLSETPLVYQFPLIPVIIISSAVFIFCAMAIYFPIRIAIKIDPAQVVRG